MKKVKIKKSELEVSQICFGGEQLGGYGWGDYSLDETVKTAELAIDRGVNFFDTADCYGRGQSEENIGILIKNRRENIIVGTKFGVRADSNKKVFYDNSLDYLDEALDNSLARMGTDYIDLYQMHYWDGTTNVDSIFERLESHVKSGKVRYYGVTNFDISAYLHYPNLVSFSNEYSLVNRASEIEIENLREHLTFFAYGALGQGILTGKYDSTSTFLNSDRRKNPKYVNFHGAKLKSNLSIIDKLNCLVNQYENVNLSQLAISWILQKYKDSVVICGMKNNSQLLSNIAAVNVTIPKTDLLLLNEINSN